MTLEADTQAWPLETLTDATMRIARLDNLDKLLSYQEQMKPLYGFSPFAFKLMTAIIPEVAASGKHTLVLGETGTGKELIVETIAKTAGMELTPVNCAAIHQNIVESELFGHVKGAFTGATQKKAGLFKEAHGHAIFLDEIGELPSATQAKLLRVTEQGEFTPVGGTKPTKVKVRVFAATNKPETLREDILWRFPERIDVPPLRERKEDIFAILHGVLTRALGKDELLGGIFAEQDVDWVFPPTTLVTLLFAPWLGNVRELRAAATRSIDRYKYWYGNRFAERLYVPFDFAPPRDVSPSLHNIQITYPIWQAIWRSVRHVREIRKFVGMNFEKVSSFEYNAYLSEFDLPRRNLFTEYSISLQDAMKLLASSFDNLVPGVRACLDKGVVTYPLWSKIRHVINHAADVWLLPSDMMALYNEGLQAEQNGRSAAQHHTPDESTHKAPKLTAFSEDGLLTEYYRQLQERTHGVQASMAEIAEKGSDAIRRRLSKYGLKR